MIGIFDSGYGGLTILKEIVAALPQYDYLYLGDNARTPYGNRSEKTITRFTEEGIRFLFERGSILIIVACNTASSGALRILQEKFLRDPASPYRDRKILGVIRPLAEAAARVKTARRIGIIGTRATIESRAFEREIIRLEPNIAVTSKACPLLVPLIEEGWHTKPEARSLLKKYLAPLKHANIDTLILGCTHYPLMIEDIRRIMGRRVKVLDSGSIVAGSLKDYLSRHHEIESRLLRGGSRTFFTSEDAARFRVFGEKFAKIKIQTVEKIDLPTCLTPTQSSQAACS